MLNIITTLVGPEGVGKASAINSIACLTTPKPLTGNCDTRDMVSNPKSGLQRRYQRPAALTNNASEVR